MSAGNVQITPNGGDAQLTDSGRCKVAYWQWDTIFVQCFGLDGNPPASLSYFGVSFVA
jgi:hypothetical protein